MMKALKHALYSFVHQKGWCEKLHNKKNDTWRTCPFVDRILLDLFPPSILPSNLFDKVLEQKEGVLSPGTILRGE